MISSHSSERIEASQNEEKDQLTGLRDRLMQMTQEIDKRMQDQLNNSPNCWNRSSNRRTSSRLLVKSLQQMDDLFAEVLRSELEQAQQAGDLEKIGKLQQ